MCKAFRWLVASVVLCVVLCGLFHDQCRSVVFADTIGGLLVGVVHGPLHVYCVWERSKDGKSLRLSRIRMIIVHAIEMDVVIGLLIGVVKALAAAFMG